MTRIAVIAGTYLPEKCYVSAYTSNLCNSLREHGIESVVLTTYYAAEAAYDPQALGVVHGWRFADLIALVQAVRASKADILHIQYSPQIYGYQPAILLLPLLLRIAGWRSLIVTTVHEYGCWEWQPQKIPRQIVEWLKQQGQHNYWWDREDGFLLTRSDAVITTTTETETLIYKRLPRLKNLVHIPIASNVEIAHGDRIVPAGDITVSSEPLQLLNHPNREGQTKTNQPHLSKQTWKRITKAHLQVYRLVRPIN